MEEKMSSKLTDSMNQGVRGAIDRLRAEQILKSVQEKTGEKITLEQSQKIQEDAKKKGLSFEKETKEKSVEQKDLIGAAEYKKASDKLQEGDLFGQMKLQAAAAFGAYGPAKAEAAIAKFGSGILASSCTGWAGFLLKIANSSTLTDRLVQNLTGSERADEIIENQPNTPQVNPPQTPAVNTTLAQHGSEHINPQQTDSLALAAQTHTRNA